MSSLSAPPPHDPSRLSLCFCDGAYDFDAETPYQQPLGGSQSALCYLAVEMARRGHRVTILSRTTQPRSVLGVECLNVDAVKEGLLQARGFDAVIVLNGPAKVSEWRWQMPDRTRLILWTQHAADQPGMQDLVRRNVRKKWDWIVCVSEWHRRTMIETLRLEPERTAVLRNAISPRFENLFASAAELRAQKEVAPLLAYTSTPFRGLDILLQIYPQLHAAFPEMRLQIFSSMRVYQMDEGADPFGALYARAQALPATDYVGSVPQPKLAEALRRCAFLSYPNTFAETSCISVMEALAAGLHVVSTALGALPETGLGHAELVAPPAHAGDVARFADAYRQCLAAAVARRAADPQGFAERRFAQVQDVNRDYTWRARAADWEAAIAGWITQRLA